MSRISTTGGTRTTATRSTDPRLYLGNRRRLGAVTGGGLIAALVLTGCGMGGGSDPSETAESPAPTETVSESTGSSGPASATASASATESASASSTETAPREGSAGEHFTNESGTFAWTVPTGWTAEQTEYDEEPVEYQGTPYEVVDFQGPDEVITFSATTGVGATDNDGPKPDVVEVIDTQELPEVPVVDGDSGFGTGAVWYRATLLQENDMMGGEGFFEGDEFSLSVQVVNVPADTEPEATDESHWSAWTYVQPPAEGYIEGTGSFLGGQIDQSTAEELTGREGEEAMRAVLETEEYGQLRDLATSMQVTAP